MRKLIYAINLTLDGCCDHTKVMADEELLDYYTQLVREVGLFVHGRKTYELMVPYWPDIAHNPSGHSKADVRFALAFDATDKVIFSRSLEKIEGNNVRLARAGLKDEILKLKQESGKPILAGGVDIPSQLIELGLIDEYRLVIQPTFAGEGRRLLEGISLQQRSKLKFIDSRVFKSGCIALHYLKQ